MNAFPAAYARKNALPGQSVKVLTGALSMQLNARIAGHAPALAPTRP